MSGPWSFFKNIYVISLKDAKERREKIKANLAQFPSLPYTIVDGVYGRKNPYLRASYKERGITDDFPHSDGLLGNIASHRMLWERALYACDTKEPTWTLIFEDDAKFHPCLTEAHMQDYLDKIPKEARLIRFGFLASGGFEKKFVPVNSHWISFQRSPAFCAVCYAVRSDFLPSLLKHKWTDAIDRIGYPYSYGAVNLEDIYEVSNLQSCAFRPFYNEFIQATEMFHGIVACEPFKSQTFVDPSLPLLQNSLLVEVSFKPVIHIITLCTGYPYEVYERFAGSLYDTGFTGHVFFLITPEDQTKIDQLKKLYSNVHGIQDVGERKRHLNCHRFFLLQNLMEQFPLPFDYVLLCDSRDVLFQRNPENYTFDKNVDLYLFEEEVFIKEEPCNKKWVTELGNVLNIDIIGEIGHKPVLCAGTTIVSKKSIHHYLKQMCLILSDKTMNIDSNLDQAVHNYLYYYGLLSPYTTKVLSNGDNLVNTVGEGLKQINDQNLIVNKANDVSYIVHQYDRFSSEDRKRISVKHNFMASVEKHQETSSLKPVIHIVTLCTGYPYSVYERFAGSLYSTGFTGRIFFLIAPGDKQKIDNLKVLYPNINGVLDVGERKSHWQSHRYFLVQNLMKQFPTPFDYIFLCDSRDVLFQRNPEDYPFDKNTDIYLFQEDIAIKDEKFNRSWIEFMGVLVEKDLIQEFGDKPVICSGTTFLSQRSINQYIEEMCKVLKDPRISPDAIWDQGPHNYVYYSGKLAPYKTKVLTNYDNLVNTVGHGFKGINDQRLIVNENNEVSYIVHQYDRFASEDLKRISVNYNFTESKEQRYIVCYPCGGITDMFTVIGECLQHAVMYNRILVIDTRKVEWFKESIHDFIHFNQPRIYKGDIDELYKTLNTMDTYPPEVKGDLSNFHTVYSQERGLFLYKNTVPSLINTLRDYAEPVIVFSSTCHMIIYNIMKFVEFKDCITSVFEERRAKLPEDYVGIHIRNTDYKSDVPTFLKENEAVFQTPFFLASDDRSTIDYMKDKYGDKVLTFSHIEHNEKDRGLHYKERNREDQVRFIIDSYVDLLLLVSSNKILSSCGQSGYSKLAKFIQNMQPGTKQFYFYNKYHYGDNIMNLKFFYNIRAFLKKHKMHINYYYNHHYCKNKDELFRYVDSSTLALLPFENVDPKSVELWMGNPIQNISHTQWVEYYDLMYKFICCNLAKDADEKTILAIRNIDTSVWQREDYLSTVYNRLPPQFKDLDILVINSLAFSGQYTQDRSVLDNLCIKLSKHYKLATTLKINEDIPCTMDSNLMLQDIGAISTRAKYVIAVYTGPLCAVYNTMSKEYVKQWFFLTTNGNKYDHGEVPHININNGDLTIIEQFFLKQENMCEFVSSHGLAKSCDNIVNPVQDPQTKKWTMPLEQFTNARGGETMYFNGQCVSYFSENILMHLKKPIILVTGDYDNSVSDIPSVDDDRILKSPYILKWVSQNCLRDHPKLMRIPIGMDYHSNQHLLEIESPIDQDLRLQQLRNTGKPFYERLPRCYTTFHFVLERGDRQEAYDNVPKNLVFYEPTKVSRTESWQRQLDYAFVLSPYGVGPDCHRTWEALTLGCIPIIKSCGLDPLFENLPVLLVKKWSDVTQELLDATIESFKTKTFQYEKLQLEYWLKLMKSH